MPETPEELDWVAEQLTWVPDVAYDALMQRAKLEVRTRNTVQANDQEAERFVVTDVTHRGSKQFYVRDRLGKTRRVEFSFLGTGVLVAIADDKAADPQTSQFEAMPFLSAEGARKWRTSDGAELYTWQLMRRALEGLFFNWM